MVLILVELGIGIVLWLWAAGKVFEIVAKIKPEDRKYTSQIWVRAVMTACGPLTILAFAGWFIGMIIWETIKWLMGLLGFTPENIALFRER